MHPVYLPRGVIMLRLSAVFLSMCMACSLVQASPPVQVIAKGLVNPRGLAFAPNGQLFVAEAGRGGNGACTVLGDGQNACYGETGALTRIDPAGVRAPVHVVSGLPSLAPQGGFGATGPHAVSFSGNGRGALVIGLGSVAAARTGLGARSALLGSVVQFSGRGRGWSVADIARFEAVNNPVPDSDSNPYGVVSLPGQSVVADAGANALFRVHANGHVSTLAVFETRYVPAPPQLNLPPGATIPMQAVPTSVVKGPDGALYAGQLTGFPFPVGAARVYRVGPGGGTPIVFADGFTNIISLAFDGAGTLYVLEAGSGPAAAPGGPPLAAPGRLLRVNADNTHTVVYDKLYYPGGVVIGRDGSAYVTNNSIVPGRVPGAFPDGGEVLRIRLE
jgi:hypothetical protein